MAALTLSKYFIFILALAQRLCWRKLLLGPGFYFLLYFLFLFSFHLFLLHHPFLILIFLAMFITPLFPWIIDRTGQVRLFKFFLHRILIFLFVLSVGLVDDMLNLVGVVVRAFQVALSVHWGLCGCQVQFGKNLLSLFLPHSHVLLTMRD